MYENLYFCEISIVVLILNKGSLILLCIRFSWMAYIYCRSYHYFLI
jgi:hypothetical protein